MTIEQIATYPKFWASSECTIKYKCNALYKDHKQTAANFLMSQTAIRMANRILHREWRRNI